MGITFRRKGTLPNQPLASAFQSGIHPLDIHKQDPLRAYADADFAGTTGNCKKSTTGFVICFYGGPIYWASRLQGVTAQSTAESEYQQLIARRHSFIQNYSLKNLVSRQIWTNLL